MASDAKTGDQVRTQARGLWDTPTVPALAAVPAALHAHATVLRTRRRQTLALALDGGETAFIVRAGALTLEVTLPDSGRQVAALLFPGDLLCSSFAPPYAEATLVVAAPGEVWRMRLAALETLAAGDPAVLRYLDDAVARSMGRQAIHAATLGQFNCEQRVATLLVDLALHTGASSPGGGIVFELPFNRKDVADYLGLNPDTLSRVMSRFKTAGIIGQLERNRALLRDFGSLAARSPAARSLMAISGGQPSGAPLGAVAV